MVVVMRGPVLCRPPHRFNEESPVKETVMVVAKGKEGLPPVAMDARLARNLAARGKIEIVEEAKSLLDRLKKVITRTPEPGPTKRVIKKGESGESEPEAPASEPAEPETPKSEQPQPDPEPTPQAQPEAETQSPSASASGEGEADGSVEPQGETVVELVLEADEPEDRPPGKGARRRAMPEAKPARRRS